MCQPSSGQRAATIESEVFYWRLLGFQVALVYGLVLVALLTGVLSIFDEAFDATVLTMTAIFRSSLLYMPQSKQLCFDCCKQRKIKFSNAKYRFSRQWSIRRQDFYFFAISSLIVLGSMLAKLANSAKTGISFSACLMGFGCRPSRGCLNGFAPSSSLSPPFGLRCAENPKKTAMETSCEPEPIEP